MKNMKIKIIEQVLLPDNTWHIPKILPNSFDNVFIESKICTNLDIILQQFILTLNDFPNNKEIFFDMELAKELQNKCEVDFFDGKFINHNIFEISDLKRGCEKWKHSFNTTVIPSFFTESLARAQFYLNNFYTNYRLLVCFEQEVKQENFDDLFLKSSITSDFI